MDARTLGGGPSDGAAWRAALAAYSPTPPAAIPDGPLGAWQLALETPSLKLYRRGDAALAAVAGTRNAAEAAETWPAVVQGRLAGTSRFAADRDALLGALRGAGSGGVAALWGAGHSLGAAIALELRRRMMAGGAGGGGTWPRWLGATFFNAALQPQDVSDAPQAPGVRILYHAHDPLYVAAGGRHWRAAVVVPPPPGTRSGLEDAPSAFTAAARAHSLRSFAPLYGGGGRGGGGAGGGVDDDDDAGSGGGGGHDGVAAMASAWALFGGTRLREANARARVGVLDVQETAVARDAGVRAARAALQAASTAWAAAKTEELAAAAAWHDIVVTRGVAREARAAASARLARAREAVQQRRAAVAAAEAAEAAALAAARISLAGSRAAAEPVTGLGRGGGTLLRGSGAPAAGAPSSRPPPPAYHALAARWMRRWGRADGGAGSERLATLAAQPLSDADLRALLGAHLAVRTYPELTRERSIADALDASGRAAVLFLTSSPSDGHWVGLLADPGGSHGAAGRGALEYFDPYGKRPDEPLTWLTPARRAALGETYARLSAMLAASAADGATITYNATPFQAPGSAIATCGRHVASRLLYRALPLPAYGAAIAASGAPSPDAFVTILTDALLHPP